MAVDGVRTRTATLRRPRVNHPHCILDDGAASPRARPLLENRVAIYGAVQTGDTALLSLLTIRSEQKREQVEAVHVLVKDLLEIGAGCVLCRSRYLFRFRHGTSALPLLVVSALWKSTTKILFFSNSITARIDIYGQLA